MRDKERIMEKETTERRIYLKDLIFSALYQWKWIFVAALLCGALLGAMEHFGGSETVTINGISITPENQIKIEQLQNTLEVTEKLVQEHTVYLEKSVLMQLDSYAAYTAVASYFVVAETESVQAETVNEAILQYYAQVARDQAVVDAAAEEMAMEPWVVGELISVTNAQTTGLSVLTRGRDAQEAQKLLEVVCAAVEKAQTAATERMGAHTLEKTSYSAGPKVDSGLFDAQYSTRQKLTTMKNTLVATKAELDRMLPTGLNPGGKKTVLFAAVGVVLGACLVVGIAWVCHISDEKVYSARVLRDRTAVRILGCVASGKKCGKLRRWLRKLEGRAQSGDMDAVAVNIRNRCENIRKLLILGNFEEEKVQPLKEKLEKAGISCTLCGDPESSAAAWEQMAACDGVVLVETCGRSRYDRVLWQQETAGDYQKELLGCVLIGG